MRVIILFLISLLFVFSLKAQTVHDSIINDKNVYELGEVVISEKVLTQDITKSEIDKINSVNVATAVNALPSVTLINVGPRNESKVFIRGFDLRSVPVFADGIPIYIPYDGYVDLARFTNFGLSKIEVSKGYSSILYGANTIGGTINMISTKPKKKLEVELKTGAYSGKGYNASGSIGSKTKKYYFQAGFSKLHREYFNLSKKFITSIYESDYKRDNSYQDDVRANIRFGFTPNNSDEYSLSYIYQHGEKGNPIYLGNDVNIRLRYWQWPRWDKQSIYFISKTKISNHSYLKTRLFYDKFLNSLKSFDDGSYSEQTMPYSFTSNYDDYSYGANFEFGTEIIQKNILKLAGHYKYDMHRENNLGEPVRHFADNTFSIGIEDVYTTSSGLKLIPGISYNLRNSLIAEDYDAVNSLISNYSDNKSSAGNIQLAAYYQIDENFNVSLTLAHKTRFASMKDRYSYRMGQAIPNPDLRSENAINYEIASSFFLNSFITLKPAIFYSDIRNTIQNVDNVLPGISQMQNSGQSRFYGADFNLKLKLTKKIYIVANYAFIERQNLSNPELLFTDVPKHKTFSYIDYSPFKGFSIFFSSEYNSDRFSTSYGVISDGFVVCNTQISYAFAKYFKLEFGINNIFDRNYTLVEGYPEQGRNLYINLYYSLN